MVNILCKVPAQPNKASYATVIIWDHVIQKCEKWDLPDSWNINLFGMALATIYITLTFSLQLNLSILEIKNLTKD